jgi:hypothetical protein
MKALYILDQREGGLVLYGHDLEDSLVEMLVAEYQAQDKHAYSVDQAGAHGGPAEICEKCRRAGEKIASGTQVYLQPAQESSKAAHIEGGIGMVSAEIDSPAQGIPNLGTPVRKLFSLFPFLAALALIGYSLVYFTGLEAGQSGDLRNTQLPSIKFTPTQVLAAQVIPDTPEPSPTLAPSRRPTSLPTPADEQGTAEAAASMEAASQEATGSEEASCIPALSVTSQHAGQNLCITGEVYRAELKEGVFSITFSKDWGNFYLLSYDRVWESAQPGACIQANGQVVMSGTIPVIVFTYRNELSLCP